MKYQPDSLWIRACGFPVYLSNQFYDPRGDIYVMNEGRQRKIIGQPGLTGWAFGKEDDCVGSRSKLRLCRLKDHFHNCRHLFTVQSEIAVPGAPSRDARLTTQPRLWRQGWPIECWHVGGPRWGKIGWLYITWYLLQNSPRIITGQTISPVSLSRDLSARDANSKGVHGSVCFRPQL